MLKWLILFTATLACAGEYTVTLPAVPGKEQVFFLDLAKTGADSSSFRLTTPDGKPVPFSFDMRLELPKAKGKYNRQPDGFYTKAQAPAAENRFMVPGWLSFKTVEGVRNYTFRFRDGAEKTLPRPDPAVRAWWVEIMRDPEFRNPGLLGFRKGKLKKLPSGGIEVQRSFTWQKKALAVDHRIKGRRIIAVIRMEGNGANYYVLNFYNAVIKRVGAIHTYFKLAPGEVTDICTEGLVAAQSKGIFRHRQAGVVIVKNAPLKILSLHVQLAPFAHSAGVKLSSDLFSGGDTATLQPYGMGYETLQKFTSGGISCARVVLWQGKLDAKLKLIDKSGKVVRTGTGLKLVFPPTIKPGKYTLQAELFISGNQVAVNSFPVEIQNKPQW